MNNKNILLVGGSSGLGFELFKKNIINGNKMFIITNNVKRLKKNIKKEKIKKILNIVSWIYQKIKI